MYKQVKTHKKFVTSSGLELEPVLTLADKYSGLVNIVLDDGCYVCYLYSEELGGFTATHYIFPELHQALCSLPYLNGVTE
jgi:hypothetical protein